MLQEAVAFISVIQQHVCVDEIGEEHTNDTHVLETTRRDVVRIYFCNARGIYNFAIFIRALVTYFAKSILFLVVTKRKQQTISHVFVFLNL